MSRSSLPKEALRARALAAIRQEPGCAGVMDIEIREATNVHTNSNWNIEIIDCGSTQVHTANRAATTVQSLLCHRYELLTDS
ncbi:MAG: hypothetical protein JWR49_3782 [Tardiphaga sp.]|jgi:hypothetical protein|nr:hypothetical protein [Tardiphaga sp.]